MNGRNYEYRNEQSNCNLLALSLVSGRSNFFGQFFITISPSSPFSPEWRRVKVTFDRLATILRTSTLFLSTTVGWSVGLQWNISRRERMDENHLSGLSTNLPLPVNILTHEHLLGKKTWESHYYAIIYTVLHGESLLAIIHTLTIPLNGNIVKCKDVLTWMVPFMLANRSRPCYADCTHAFLFFLAVWNWINSLVR